MGIGVHAKHEMRHSVGLISTIINFNAAERHAAIGCQHSIFECQHSSCGCQHSAFGCQHYNSKMQASSKKGSLPLKSKVPIT